MQRTLYDQFIEKLEKSGLKKVSTILEDKDVELSNDDKILIIRARDCQIISIKGVRDSSIKGQLITPPHYIYLKIYENDGNELLNEDTLQFSIAELKRSGLPSSFSDEWPRVIYYHYPYRSASKLKLKKGIILTKNKRLEIRIIRNGKELEIGKFEIQVECDKWFDKI